MFDFEKFPVYLKTEDFYSTLYKNVLHKNISINLKNQLQRASSSILLNIAEGAGKYSKKDKKNFYTIARGSVNECVAIIRILKIENKIDLNLFNHLHNELYTIHNMLTGLIKYLTK